ncbi:hypothetical protein B5X24_HaOG213054 [Helicoverpa armigera]|nr:hypothetical protein B5X24_HaOG213054 [Helicoverpa armigera]
MHHPRRNALRLQSAPPSRRNCSPAAPGLARRDVTRPVTSYQATRTTEEVNNVGNFAANNPASGDLSNTTAIMKKSGIDDDTTMKNRIYSPLCAYCRCEFYRFTSNINRLEN